MLLNIGKLMSYAFLAVLFIQPAAESRSADFSDGITAYNSQQYSSALSHFSRAAQAAPADPTIRYYLGLCYQGMNQTDLACAQYEWVARVSSGVLRTQASAALANLQKHVSNRNREGSSPDTRRANTSANGTKSSGTTVRGRLKILEFYTDWCPYCKGFQPVWDSVASRMRGQVDMRQINADDDDNAALKERYKIHSYPRLVYTDDTGIVLKEWSYYDTQDEFISDINELLAVK